jgi:broad specificity phosphatase PhoE
MEHAPRGTTAPLSRSKWPLRLVVMRHAESESNRHRAALEQEGTREITISRDTRDADFRLTANGREQAERAGRGLDAYGPFDVLFVSPYRRTRETAEILGAGLKHRPPLIVEERIREREFGILENLTRFGVRQKFPEEVERKRLVGKYYYRPPGGESYPDVNLRLHSFLGTLVREHAGRRVLVVTHSVVVLLFRRLLERMEEKEVLELDRQDEVKNASLLIYDLGSRDGRQGVLVRKAWNLVL